MEHRRVHLSRKLQDHAHQKNVKEQSSILRTGFAETWVVKHPTVKMKNKGHFEFLSRTLTGTTVISYSAHLKRHHNALTALLF